jgi:uncharacterized HhH-GPD family protein
MTLHITGDTDADALLNDNAFALILGVLLDQQVAMESAFAGPLKIRDRAGTLEPAALAEFDPDELVEAFKITPAVHRYPGSMAGRVQALSKEIAETWGGDVTALWTSESPNGKEILRRLKALPGFGEQKAKIFLALLGKRLGIEAEGWREASSPYGEEGSFRSVADIVDPESLGRVRETKKAAKAAAKQK